MTPAETGVRIANKEYPLHRVQTSTSIRVQLVEVLAAPELKGVKRTKKSPPKSGSPALFWVLFAASFLEALEPNTSKLVGLRVLDRRDQ